MQILQMTGAMMILGAFALAQTGKMRPDRYLNIYLNLAGASLLAVSAYSAEQWGFLLLNTCWSLIAAWGLFHRLLLATDER